MQRYLQLWNIYTVCIGLPSLWICKQWMCDGFMKYMQAYLLQVLMIWFDVKLICSSCMYITVEGLPAKRKQKYNNDLSNRFRQFNFVSPLNTMYIILLIIMKINAHTACRHDRMIEYAMGVDCFKNMIWYSISLKPVNTQTHKFIYFRKTTKVALQYSYSMHKIWSRYLFSIILFHWSPFDHSIQHTSDHHNKQEVTGVLKP